MWQLPPAKKWNVDLDKYINPIVPRNLTYLLPRPFSHFLGYRDTPRKEVGNVIVAAWALVGAFIGVIVIEAVFMVPEIRHHGPPLIIGSFVSAEENSMTVAKSD